MRRRWPAWATWALASLAGLAIAAALHRWVLFAPPGTFVWTIEGRRHELVEPRALALLLVVPALIVALGRSLADLPWQQRVLALLFRVAFVGLLALALGRLVRTTETRKVATVVLVDVSDSVSDQALEDARALLGRVWAARGPEDTVRLVTFAERARRVEVSVSDGRVVVPEVGALRHAPERARPGDRPGAASDLGAALALGWAVLPPGYLPRVVLASDGLETQGNLLGEASRARRLGARLYAVPYRRPPPGEVAIQRVRAPGKVKIGEVFELVATVYASRASRSRARLYQGEALNGLDGVRELELAPGPNEVAFRSVVRVGGEVTYELKLEPLGEDSFPANNRWTVSLDVPGRPVVLYVAGRPERARLFTSALAAQELEVDVRGPSAFPGSLRELERYDFVVLSDVPREAVSLGSQALIEQWVRALGGGFLMAGGASGFGLGGWGGSPLEKILPVRMDVDRRKDQPGVAMMLVIDRSGSMSGLPMEMAKAACRATVGTLEGDDLVGVIAFDSSPTRYVKLQPARYRNRIQNDLARIQPGGGTEIFSALDQAYQDLAGAEARRKHAVLLTDGRAPAQGLRDIVQAMQAESITLTTVGLGEGTDQALLRSLADLGGGRFHYVPDPNALPRIFTRETELVARQAAVEEWFPVEQTAHADYLRGISIATAPLLHGYVATRMKPAPAQQILASDRGEPILAELRLGLGRTLAWTSDLETLWAGDWARWSQWSQLWGQVVRETMRKKHRKELGMRAEVVGGKVRAVVDAFTVDERFDNDLVSKLVVTGPAPGKQQREVAMRQTAPGRYEAELGLDAYGSFTLRADHSRRTPDGGLAPAGVSYGQVSQPYPLEYARFEPDLELLERFALAGGGAVDPEPAAIFDPGPERLTAYEPLFGRFLLAALVVFLLDLLVRRVRLFDRGFRGTRSRHS
ncbi:MAG: VWA domain-containing protein [Polyangiaceae bacterium]|nr:VWA domain-containing protein [Polyangiaceae bacterium]